MQIRSSQKQEALVYAVLWTALFVAPVISLQTHHSESFDFYWSELFEVWKQVGLLFVVFLLHNFLLAPLLIYKQKRWLYITSIVLLTVCFALIQCADRPAGHFHERPPMELAEGLPPHGPHAHHRPNAGPPFIFGQHDLMLTIIMILMLGMDLGVKLYFKQREDLMRMTEMEKENLQQQLEYLRYQINPHFLMNTLNNIHALVDIDGERAKETIVELSKLMRYALYEGSHQKVPLNRDIAFLESYIQLMRLRYSNKVSITVQLPRQLPEREIPPMLFITFVENAFKHGVSYQQDSFITIAIDIQDESLLFTCQNSKVKNNNPNPKEDGGVGLQNAQRRLQLIYGNTYHLEIDETGNTYNIELKIPLSS